MVSVSQHNQLDSCRCTQLGTVVIQDSCGCTQLGTVVILDSCSCIQLGILWHINIT